METKQTIDLLTNELMDKIWFPYNWILFGHEKERSYDTDTCKAEERSTKYHNILSSLFFCLF